MDPECRTDRIAMRGAQYDATAMRTPVTFPSLERSADNELYDRGCDLVAAATAIRHVAGSPDAARAVPAVLGCVEAALRELAEAVAGLERTTDAASALRAHACQPNTIDSRSERMHRGYANLRQALADAERAAAAARPLASRVLAQAASR
jgi:hypothetical protein